MTQPISSLDPASLDPTADSADERPIPSLDDLLEEWSWQAVSDIERGLSSVDSNWRSFGGLIG